MRVPSTLRAQLRTAASPLVLGLTLVLTAGCAASGGAAASTAASGGSSSGNASAAPSAPAEVTSEQAAAHLVGLENPLLAGVRPRAADSIGQAHWWDATKTAKGWRLVYTLGWGDCLAGCIQGHMFTYDVTRDGQVTLVDESGETIPADVRAALASKADTPVVAQGLSGRVTAGPVCPVEKPGDPNCAPRPVAGATLVVRRPDGAEAARLTSDANGAFAIELPVGDYVLEPQPVEGLMGTPAPIQFRVDQGRAAELDVSYDTGIR